MTGALSGNHDGTVDTSAGSSTREGARAADDLSEAKALLLLRAMVTAANSDGSVSPEERERILGQASAESADDRAALERELANPRPLEELLTQVRDRETAEEFYLASSVAIEGGTNTHRTYLAYLRERLGLGEQEADEIEQLAR